ncbi:MAG: DUF58 domain-containing protein, partial [Gaiellaceae bacterium]
ARRARLEDIGIHRSRLAGRGTEFERIRDYTPDDEYRQIDWKATARRQRPMTRVYEAERSQNGPRLPGGLQRLDRGWAGLHFHRLLRLPGRQPLPP